MYFILAQPEYSFYALKNDEKHSTFTKSFFSLFQGNYGFQIAVLNDLLGVLLQF
jgi:hypothetical protein